MIASPAPSTRSNRWPRRSAGLTSELPGRAITKRSSQPTRRTISKRRVRDAVALRPASPALPDASATDQRLRALSRCNRTLRLWSRAPRCAARDLHAGSRWRPASPPFQTGPPAVADCRQELGQGMGVVVLKIEWITATDDLRVAAAASMGSRYFREALGPEEPDYPAAELVSELTPAPGVVEARVALALDGGELVGAALQRFPLNQRMSSWIAWLYVLPRARRAAVGRALFEAAVEEASRDGRHRLGWKTASNNEPANALSTATGAAPAGTLEHNRLRTAAVERPTLVGWVDRARDRGSEYSLVGWDGECPDELLDQFTRLQAVMDDAPGVEPELVVAETRESTRLREQRWLARGPYWRLCVRHDPTGDLVGFTELQVPATRPGIADQGDTAVHPDHRERGLGRWLKAVNMLRLVDRRPEVRFVDTIDAADNGPMLSINGAMGFTPVLTWQRWDLQL